jgi:hypothetical protein
MVGVKGIGVTHFATWDPRGPASPAARYSRKASHAVHARNTFSLFLSFIILFSPVVLASTTTLDSTDTRDNLHCFYSRTELSWLSDEIGDGLFQASGHATYVGGSSVNGIPGGQRLTGGGSLGWIQAVSPLELRGFAGMDEIPLRDSWRAEARLTYKPAYLPGVALAASAKSGWLDGWFTHRIRSSLAKATLAYASNNDWAEAGAAYEERSGGVQPATPLPMDLRKNRLTLAYGWWSHTFLNWFSSGLAVKGENSHLDFHQPAAERDTNLIYVDYPYPTPHQEVSIGILGGLHLGPVQLKANWPLFSSGNYRAETQYNTGEIYYYRAHGMTMADVRAVVSLPRFAGFSIKGELFAQSRPYAPYRWFTTEAWNQAGIDITVGFAPKPEKATP